MKLKQRRGWGTQCPGFIKSRGRRSPRAQGGGLLLGGRGREKWLGLQKRQGHEEEPLEFSKQLTPVGRCFLVKGVSQMQNETLIVINKTIYFIKSETKLSPKTCFSVRFGRHGLPRCHTPAPQATFPPLPICTAGCFHQNRWFPE